MASQRWFIFLTKATAVLKLQLPEFDCNKTIQWRFYVDETTNPSESTYDMIIGGDLLQQLGIILNYKENNNLG